MMRKIIFILLFVFTFSDSVLAAGKTERGMMLRFTSFGMPFEEKEFVLRQGEALSEPFAIPNNGFSIPVLLPGKMRELVVGVQGDGEESFRALFPVLLPEGGKRFLVIVYPKKKKAHATVIDAETSGFRPGDVMIFNLAAETLAADLGGEKMTFKPGSESRFRPQRKGEQPNYQVAFYSSVKGRTKMFAANMWPHFSHKRSFVFLYLDSRTKRPTYRAVDEFTEWLEVSQKSE